MRLTQSQAIEFLEGQYITEPDEVTATHIEAFIWGASIEDVRIDFDRFCASLGVDVDPDSVTMMPDVIEALELPATKLTIKTEIA